MWGVEWGALLDEVLLVLEVAHLLMESPPFQMVADAGELLIFPLNFSNDGASISFELGASFVVMVVALNLGGGSEVHHTDNCSQGKEGGSIRLQELFAPVGHGVNLPR